MNTLPNVGMSGYAYKRAKPAISLILICRATAHTVCHVHSSRPQLQGPRRIAPASTEVASRTQSGSRRRCVSKTAFLQHRVEHYLAVFEVSNLVLHRSPEPDSFVYQLWPLTLADHILLDQRVTVQVAPSRY